MLATYSLKLIVLILLFNITIAQQHLNFSFEKRSVESHRPWGWESTLWGKSNFMIDSTTVKNGKYSLKAQFKDNAGESYKYALEVLDLVDKNIKLHGFIKGQNISNDVTISVQYSFDDGSNDYQNDQVNSRNFSGTFDWTSFSVSVKLPKTVKFVNVLINIQGEGSIWIDNMKLYINDMKVNELNVAKPFSKDQFDWFSKNVISFNSPLPRYRSEDSTYEDLQFFKHIVGNSNIVALGESTHGTHEFFTLKHKLLQYAVEEMGFRVFAIEDHQLIARNVDQYIKSGVGTARKSMSGMFGVWMRQEVLDLIEWLRSYNSQHQNDMVSFIGVDIQNINPSINNLIKFLNTQDRQLLAKIKPKLEQLQDNAKNIFFTTDTIQKQKWIDEANEIYKRVLKKKSSWINLAKDKIERDQILYGLQYARLVVQFFQEGLQNGQMLYRDEAMAENLSWYIDQIQPNAKVVLWAHDVHISRGEHPIKDLNLHSGKSMGSFLAKRYKTNYKAFGLSTYSGKYSAFKTYAYKELIESPLYESPVGTIEEVLHRISTNIGNGNLFLPFNQYETWLTMPVPVRFANHVSFDYSFWTRISVPNQFDGIFFIDHTSASKLFK